jgi:hypothetical protein
MSGAPDASGSGAQTGAESAPAPGWKSRLASLERRLNRRSTSPTARRWLLVVSLIAFVTIAVLSYLSLPDGQTFNWWMAPILIVVLTPVTVLANAAEFKVMAKFSGRPFGWIASCRLTLIATAANLLPLPGGIMIRTQALRAEGATYKRALGANAIAGGAWVAVGAVATGALLLSYQGFSLIGTGSVVVGVLATATVIYLMRRVHRRDYLPMFVRLGLVEVMTVLVAAIRVMVSFAFLNLSINPAQAVALTTPTILAAAIGIFPAGLGLRELLAGAVALVVNLPVGQSVAATAVDRVFSQIGLAMMSGLVLLIGGRKAFMALPAEPAEQVDADAAGVEPLVSGADGDAGVEVPHHGL